MPWPIRGLRRLRKQRCSSSRISARTSPEQQSFWRASVFSGKSALTESASHRRPRCKAGVERPPGTTTQHLRVQPDRTLWDRAWYSRFTVQDEAAFAFTAADQGVDINVAANLQNWLTTPVQTNRDVLRLVRSYHKQVIRPEYYNIAIQLETALKHIDDKVF